MIGRRFGRSERPRQDGSGQGLQAGPVGDEAIGGGLKVGKGEPVQLVVDLTQESPQLLSLCGVARVSRRPAFGRDLGAQGFEFGLCLWKSCHGPLHP